MAGILDNFYGIGMLPPGASLADAFEPIPPEAYQAAFGRYPSPGRRAAPLGPFDTGAPGMVPFGMLGGGPLMGPLTPAMPSNIAPATGIPSSLLFDQRPMLPPATPAPTTSDIDEASSRNRTA